MFPFPFSFVAPTASGLADIDNVYSMEFDGVDDYFETSLNVTSGNKSISFWFNSSYAGYQSILGDATDGFVLGNFSSQLPTPNGISYTDQDTGKKFGITASTTDEFADGNWHNFIYTYDGNSKIYIDGTERTISYRSGTTSSDDIVIIDNLGLGLNLTGYPSFSGNLDEVALFDYALDSDQVEEIYNATSTGKTADLSDMATPPVAWYRMGD